VGWSPGCGKWRTAGWRGCCLPAPQATRTRDCEECSLWNAETMPGRMLQYVCSAWGHTGWACSTARRVSRRGGQHAGHPTSELKPPPPSHTCARQKSRYTRREHAASPCAQHERTQSAPREAAHARGGPSRAERCGHVQPHLRPERGVVAADARTTAGGVHRAVGEVVHVHLALDAVAGARRWRGQVVLGACAPYTTQVHEPHRYTNHTSTRTPHRDTHTTQGHAHHTGTRTPHRYMNHTGTRTTAGTRTPHRDTHRWQTHGETHTAQSHAPCSDSADGSQQSVQGSGRLLSQSTNKHSEEEARARVGVSVSERAQMGVHDTSACGALRPAGPTTGAVSTPPPSSLPAHQPKQARSPLRSPPPPTPILKRHLAGPSAARPPMPESASGPRRTWRRQR
jgi:hypothetical protein